MHGTRTLQEADRLMTVCNSCRYCEGLCAVFPAMEMRRAFSDGDLNYLANLCHSCGACYTDCQFSPPHEFNVNVPKTLAIARKLGWQFDIMSTSFFVSRRSLKPSAQSGMPQWQDHLFIAMSRSANDATDYFQIPTGRVVEVGTQVTI